MDLQAAVVDVDVQAADVDSYADLDALGFLLLGAKDKAGRNVVTIVARSFNPHGVAGGLGRLHM